MWRSTFPIFGRQACCGHLDHETSAGGASLRLDYTDRVLLDIAKVLLAPGSISLLIVALLVGVATLRFSQWRRLATAWCGLWLTAYLLLAMPITSRVLIERFEQQSRPMLVPDATADAVIVLSGDSASYRIGHETAAFMTVVTAVRIREAARVYHLLGSPYVIASGTGAPALGVNGPDPQSMLAGLLALGVPSDRIVLEASSTDTQQSAREVGRLFEQMGLRRGVLVTSSVHLPRAVRAYEAVGLDVIGSAAPSLSAARWRWRLLVPSASGMSGSSQVLHEYVGIAYYWVRGWL